MDWLVAKFAAITKLDKVVVWTIVAAVIFFLFIGTVTAAGLWHRGRISALMIASEERGRLAERVEWEKASADERLRQSDAAARAIAEGQAAAVKLARERDALEAQIEDMIHASDASPDGGDVALDADRVRRLDALRRR
jgi:hypothetical protein